MTTKGTNNIATGAEIASLSLALTDGSSRRGFVLTFDLQPLPSGALAPIRVWIPATGLPGLALTLQRAVRAAGLLPLLGGHEAAH
jgi:hypothetical protein